MLEEVSAGDIVFFTGIIPGFLEVSRRPGDSAPDRRGFAPLPPQSPAPRATGSCRTGSWNEPLPFPPLAEGCGLHQPRQVVARKSHKLPASIWR